MAFKQRCSTAPVLAVLFYTLLFVIFTSGFSVRNEVPSKHPQIAPALTPDHINHVSSQVAAVMGDVDGKKADRYASARSLSIDMEVSRKELVYGELSVPVLATLLDAVGVQQGDCFLDIGSGDGGLVLGASLLYPDYITKCRGLELVPGLVKRSKHHAERLSMLEKDMNSVEFLLGDVHEGSTDASISIILQNTTLSVCFATTWSAGNIKEAKRTSLQRRLLPKLSKALTHLPLGARVIMVDARLDEKDGYSWEGDLKIQCPDTAPFSIASLYRRRNP